eukprot:m.12901 g.12901  ORF g.12901 m.12901 type:complete len:436 (-) comp5878_c0_seq1:461-1768(-)
MADKTRTGVLHRVTDGLLKKSKASYCATDGETFRWHKSDSPSSPVYGQTKIKDIFSVGKRHEDDGRTHTEFVITCRDGAHEFRADTMESMRQWIEALRPPPKPMVDGMPETVCGWLEVDKTMRFVEIRRASLALFKTQEDSDPCGAIMLDSLCAIVPPKVTLTPVGDRRKTVSGRGFVFQLYTARQQHALMAKSMAEVNRWVGAIQDTIESCPELTTKFEKYLTRYQSADIKQLELHLREHAILCYTDEPLEMPLTPMPYFPIGKVRSGNSYGYPHLEAMEIFNTMLPKSSTRYGSVHETHQWIQNLLQVYLEIPLLRNEIFCQAMKQVTRIPLANSDLRLAHWQLLAALCLHFIPAPKYLAYLRTLLHYSVANPDNPDIVKGAANYCLRMMQKEHQVPGIDSEGLRAIFDYSALTTEDTAKAVLDTTQEAETDA